MKIVVIGGGFIAQLVQLAIPDAILLDARPVAPTNHLDTRVGPQYLWEPIPGVVSVSFPVTTLVDGQPPFPDKILAYKRKIGKEKDGGDWGLQFRWSTTGWRSNLPTPRVEYNKKVVRVNAVDHNLLTEDGLLYFYDNLVNTIPMPFFMDLLVHQIPRPEPFRMDPIWMSFDHAIDPIVGMILNYNSDIQNPIYRTTQVDDMIYRESLQAHQTLPLVKKIVPGKIHPHPRNEQYLAALRAFHIYCFGRFATWRPDELAHETWKKIEVFKLLHNLRTEGV